MKKLKNYLEWQAFGVCTAIGEKIGLEHTEYLSRIFRKKVGITPGKFRARVQAAAAADQIGV